ncbi:MAG TPA: hypothetical protein VLE48_12575, partial [Terriglobales bacterium]|nr:hypothetical protein [Terriglobales bacterium]
MATPAPVSGYKDRSTWLVVFGILQGLLGLAILGMIPLLLLSLTIAPKAQAGSARADLIQISMTYLGMAAIAFVLAGGSIWPQRWARALTVAYCWMWLSAGLITIPLFAFLLPRMTRQMPNSPPPGAEGAQMFAIGFAVFFLTMLFVVTPGTILLFYSSGNVKATVEARDPHPRWTDRCPTPVLVLGVFNMLGALSLIAAVFGRLAAFPLFGLVVSGFAARAAYLVSALVWAMVAWGVLTM